MKSTSFALGSLLATIAVAQPHRQHQAFHHKREGPPVVWVTELDYVTEIVPYTTTIWVSEGFVAPSSTHTKPSSSKKSSSSSSVTPVPAQFFEPAKSSSASPSPPPAPTTSSSASVYVAPPAPPTSVAPTTAAPPTYVAPAPSPSTVPVVSSVAPYVPPSSYSAPAPAPVSSTPPSSGGGDCSAGSPCTGDMTYYDTGMGACGWDNDGSTENVVALSHLLMGAQSNGNPFCGRTITIEHNGKTTTAKCVDKCMGCDMWNIDLSDKAFMDLADMGVGRTTATWYFND